MQEISIIKQMIETAEKSKNQNKRATVNEYSKYEYINS